MKSETYIPRADQDAFAKTNICKYYILIFRRLNVKVEAIFLFFVNNPFLFGQNMFQQSDLYAKGIYYVFKEEKVYEPIYNYYGFDNGGSGSSEHC